MKKRYRIQVIETNYGNIQLSDEDVQEYDGDIYQLVNEKDEQGELMIGNRDFEVVGAVDEKTGKKVCVNCLQENENGESECDNCN